MARSILDEHHIHAAVRQKVSEHFRDTIQEVQTAIGQHRIVVVGMSGNFVVTKARRLLEEKNLEFTYLEYGSYFKQWRRRTSLKMWTGWATFPMVFVDGTLVGGYQDLKALDDSGELHQMLTSRRN